MQYAEAHELMSMLPGLEPERAGQLLVMASLAIDAHTHLPIPADPVPDAVRVACLMQAARIARTQTDGQPVIQESVSGYSVGYAHPGRSDYAMILPQELRQLLSPWRNHSNTADLLEGEYEARMAAQASP